MKLTTPPPISLIPMNATAFAHWRDLSAQSYARDKVESGQWAAAGALDRARAELDQRLSQGVETPGHALCHLVTEDETVVGYLWWFERDLPSGRIGYVFDIEIHEAHRRQGHARNALEALASELRQRAVHRLDLHVFAKNTGAIRLYESLGYRTTSVNMSLDLSLPDRLDDPLES